MLIIVDVYFSEIFCVTNHTDFENSYFNSVIFITLQIMAYNFYNLI